MAMPKCPVETGASSPLYLLIFAQQRGTFSGATPRPYTTSPSKGREIIRVIEDGKSAFEAGKAFGEQLKSKVPQAGLRRP